MPALCVEIRWSRTCSAPSPRACRRVRHRSGAHHDLRTRKLSIARCAGLRAAAVGDYRSWTVGTGVELRRWRRQPMRGWYGGVHLDVAATRTTNEMESRALGTTWTTTAGLSLGDRVVLLHAIALTPAVSYDVLVERAPMERAATREVAVIALGAGVSF